MRDAPGTIAVARSAALCINLITGPIVARAVGPSGRGQTAAALALFNLVPVVVSFGSHIEVRRLAAIESGTSAIHSGHRLALLSAMPVSIVAIICHQTLFNGMTSSVRTTATVGVALSVFTVAKLMDISHLVANERYATISLILIAQPATYLVLICTIALVSNLSVLHIILSNIVSLLGAWAVGAGAIGRTHGDSKWSTVFRRGLPYAGGSLADAGTSRLDQVLALPLLGSQAAGLYSVAVTVATLPLPLAHALAAASFQKIARAKGDNLQASHREALGQAMAIAILVIPVIAVAAVLGIPLVFGSDFVGSIDLTLALLPGTFCFMVSYVVSSNLNAGGRGWATTSAQMSGLAINTLLLVLLGPHLGAMAAALASTVCYGSILLLLLVHLGGVSQAKALRARHFRSGLLVLLGNKGD